jgi:hypothetical protein
MYRSRGMLNMPMLRVAGSRLIRIIESVRKAVPVWNGRLSRPSSSSVKRSRPSQGTISTPSVGVAAMNVGRASVGVAVTASVGSSAAMGVWSRAVVTSRRPTNSSRPVMSVPASANRAIATGASDSRGRVGVTAGPGGLGGGGGVARAVGAGEGIAGPGCGARCGAGASARAGVVGRVSCSGASRGAVACAGTVCSGTGAGRGGFGLRGA